MHVAAVLRGAAMVAARTGFVVVGSMLGGPILGATVILDTATLALVGLAPDGDRAVLRRGGGW